MRRRDMLRASLAGAVGAGGVLWAPKALLAEPAGAKDRAKEGDILTAPLAGGLYYTRDRPGRWAGKEEGHLPVVERDGNVIRIHTPHPQDGFKHYIVKHLVLDENFQVMVDTGFNPWRDDPVSSASIAGAKNAVYAVSVCNIHDAWLTAVRLS